MSWAIFFTFICLGLILAWIKGMMNLKRRLEDAIKACKDAEQKLYKT